MLGDMEREIRRMRSGHAIIFPTLPAVKPLASFFISLCCRRTLTCHQKSHIWTFFSLPFQPHVLNLFTSTIKARPFLKHIYTAPFRHPSLFCFPFKKSFPWILMGAPILYKIPPASFNLSFPLPHRSPSIERISYQFRLCS